MIFGSQAYTDASQLADDTAQQAYTMGAYNQGVDPKTALMAQKAQAAMYNPLYKSMLGYNNTLPKYDLSGASSWSEGLSKGLGNILMGQQYRNQQNEDKQNLLAWQNQLEQQNQAAQVAQQLQQHETDRQAEHIAQQYGPEAAFAFRLNPKKYGENFATGFGQLPTAGALHYQQSYGTGLGQNQSRLDNLSDNENFFKTNEGFNLSDVGTGQVTPEFANAYNRVFGSNPTDLLDFKGRQYDLGSKKNTYQAGTVDNQTRGAKNNAELAGKTLDNQNKVIQNKILQIKAQFEAPNSQAELEKKYADLTERNKAMAARDAAQNMVQLVSEQMAQGKNLTPQDAARLDTVLKAAGVSTDFLGDIKTIQNPKVGQPIKAKAGANGWVTLSSGTRYNPKTGEVQANGGSVKPKPKPYEKGIKPELQGTSISPAHSNQPGMFWKLGDMFNDAIHNGGPILQ